MRIHKEGASIILITASLAAVVAGLCLWLLPLAAALPVSVAALAAVLFVTSFFRCPEREILREDDTVFSPADGTVVAIEEVEENEYFHDSRIVVSVFMSLWNVHVNWFPVAGTVDYFRHHHGLFLVAWHPKSSEDNERTTTVVDMGGRKILFRQIAGLVARRIVSYARVGHRVEQNSQCGFIKFGSRVDLFLPSDAEILVRLGDKVTGTQTRIARLKP
ncbi:phosphatidylserine decarboxylase family protein [uncultured Alistipes sp.]|uniref:phosphatidylserine decarboxylase family protein n=1 Tax=uncultured Alistipes sp. TaxID=538949 RepID=UPI002626815C|nr:phosphatidylserine decarboxylase family protein [uncultured Alistipes sp.]